MFDYSVLALFAVSTTVILGEFALFMDFVVRTLPDKRGQLLTVTVLVPRN